MKIIKISIVLTWVSFAAASILPTTLWAKKFPNPYTYMPTHEQIEKEKRLFDDPRPVLKNYGPTTLPPKEMVQYLTHDINKMKSLWEEIVGFKAPDVVGKIAPEVKPGKYSWQDVKSNPGLQELLPESIMDMIREPGPPFAGAIAEFEIIPTRQYYYPLPIAEATKQNLGKAKLDDKGYMITESIVSGIPFPRPSGKFKGRQILYDSKYRYIDYGLNFLGASNLVGFDSNIKQDNKQNYYLSMQRLGGRVMFEPKGFLNDRAAERREHCGIQIHYNEPRDITDMIWQSFQFQAADVYNQDMLYIPSMRRIRKLSATDTQDPMPGISSTYDDVGIFNQKISPVRYPMECKVVEEREYLMLAPTEDGSEYIRSDDMAMVNVKLERRPVYLLECTLLDTNYVYSKRVIYFDKEFLTCLWGDYYDQKGRKYRSQYTSWGWIPQYGNITGSSASWHYIDYVDKHSEIEKMTVILPADWPENAISLRNLMKKSKIAGRCWLSCKCLSIRMKFDK